MRPDEDTPAVIALLRLPPARHHASPAELLEQAGSGHVALKEALSASGTLFAPDPQPLLDAAQASLRRWQALGWHIITVLDADYPANLRAVHDRPALLFLSRAPEPADERSVAVIGTRRPTAAGLALGGAISTHLASLSYVVISGLAAGIDTAAHEAALAAGGRTVAVLGTGLDRAYPPENAALQARIASAGALVSPFWPGTPPSAGTFRRRNVVMSGLTRATVIVEAGERSGTRTQARAALLHGRAVFLTRLAADQEWARVLSQRPGVLLIDSPREITDRLERLYPAPRETHG